jgi:hypothetical protein
MLVGHACALFKKTVAGVGFDTVIARTCLSECTCSHNGKEHNKEGRLHGAGVVYKLEKPLPLDTVSPCRPTFDKLYYTYHIGCAVGYLQCQLGRRGPIYKVSAWPHKALEAAIYPAQESYLSMQRLFKGLRTDYNKAGK